MTDFITQLAKRKTCREMGEQPPLANSRDDFLDRMILEARNVKPVVVTITPSGGINLDNPNNLPISIQDYEGVEFMEVEIDDFGDAARQDKDGDWYIERGNQ